MLTERPPAFAGRFYPADENSCNRALDSLLVDVGRQPAFGAIVPHAGWIYSGPTAALALARIAAANPKTVVLFGAVHLPDPNPASIFSAGSWQTPLGPLFVHEELARRLSQNQHIEESPAIHTQEHSIEVQLPLLKRLLPDVQIVPIMVRPGPEAPDIGRFCATETLATARNVAFVGTTDLTHYGPAFGFEPHGRGRAGIRWAKDVNDRRFIELIQAMDADAVVPEAAARRNACGAGAVAATIAAMNEAGAVRYDELAHTCSADVAAAEDPDPLNSVGYEAGVFVQSVA